MLSDAYWKTCGMLLICPWHVWQVTPAFTWRMCGKRTYSGTLCTRTHGTGCFLFAYAASFWISGRSAPMIKWHPMHVPTAGSPGSGDLNAAKWQNTQLILSVFTCTGWGNLMGWTGEGPVT